MKKLFVIFVAIAMVGAFAATTMAAEWSFYGSARMATFQYDASKEVLSEKARDDAGLKSFFPQNRDNPMFETGPDDKSYDDSDLTWALQGNSRIGANVKFSDTLSGRFEYGTGVNLRILYGEWNFGAGKLLVGQTYTPITHLNSNMVAWSDDGMFSCGEPYAGRLPMLQLTFGGLKIALVKPNTVKDAFSKVLGNELLDEAIAAGDADAIDFFNDYLDYLPDTDTDTTLPKIEAKYTFATDMFKVSPYGGYQTFDRVYHEDKEEGIDSYIVGLNAKVNFGPAYVIANVWTSENLDEYGDGYQQLLPAIWDGNSYEDAEATGGQIILNFKAGDMLTFEAGYGFTSAETEVYNVDFERDTSLYYVNCNIKLAENVFVVPEIGKLDYDKLEITGETDEKLGDLTYFGAKWQINF